MKIQMIAPTPFFASRGCHIRILEEAKALQKLGHEVDIFTYHCGNDMDGVNIYRTPNIPWYGKLEAGPSYHQSYIDMLLALKSSKKAGDYDIVHGHLHEGGLIGGIAKSFHGTPLVIDLQGSLTGEMVSHNFIEKNSLQYKFFRGLEDISQKQGDAIICSNSVSSEKLKKDFDFEIEKVNVVKDGVDLNFFSPDKASEDLCEKLEIDGEEVIVYTGLLNEYQGTDLLLESAKLVLEKKDNVKFLIVGFPNVEKYRSKSEELGIQDKFIFTGKVDYQRIPEYLSLGDIATSPKIALSGEANLKLTTYMAAELPTVVFNHQVNREILGDSGIYSDFRDEKDLAQNFLYLLKKPRERKELGEKSRERAKEKFSWTSKAEKITGIYKDVRK